jgi:hypothetical protein
MARKIDAAADHGVDAFIFDWYYYDPDDSRAAKAPHYSQDGSRYLHTALENGFLGATNNARLKFAVLWCNHDAWPNAKGAVEPKAFETLTDYVIEKYFKHPSYWKIDGCPYFSIYAVNTFIETFGGDQEKAAAALPVPYHVNVSMGWDSSPRCPANADWMTKRGYPFGAVIVNNTPERFRDALLRAKELALQRPPNERIITINAWNEWGEGSYLEPDTVHGMKYLEAVREVFGTIDARKGPDLKP